MNFSNVEIEISDNYSIVYIENFPQEEDLDQFNDWVAEKVSEQVGYEAALSSNWVQPTQCKGWQCEFTRAEYLEEE